MGSNATDLEILSELIATGWNNARVLIVGDVMLDKYAFGHVTRISPEAPVPIVQAHRTKKQPGGAANVAMNIACLGANVVFAGFVGHDADGHTLKKLLDEQHIEICLVTAEDTPITSKLRIMGGTQQIVRLDYEQTSPHSQKTYSTLLSQVAAVLPSISVLILSDYAKGVLSPEICQHLILMAHKQGIPIMVDPKCKDFSRYAGATTICPNLTEISLATGVSADEINHLLSHAQGFVTKFGLDYLTVTMSEKGICVLWPQARHQSPAVNQQVFDVSGAGDTVIAVLALCAACNVDVKVAAALANLAAGMVVSKLGTVPVGRDELLAALKQLDVSTFSKL